MLIRRLTPGDVLVDAAHGIPVICQHEADFDVSLSGFIKEKIEPNRPVAIGVSILELSKRLMYSFLYDVLYPFYGGPQFVQPMYMDTGGLIL